jgi:tRNA A-37 threonylcarbamoyl transferase component Bud32
MKRAVPGADTWIDDVVFGFNRRCKEGRAPLLEDDSREIENELGEAGVRRAELLVELLETELKHRRDRGEDPAVEAYLRRFPGDSDLILEAFKNRDASDLTRSARASLIDRPPAPIPDRVGRFKILGAIGEGGFGVVYKALDETLGREVAIKVLRPEARPRVDGNLLGRFVREARRLANLRHSNIVTIHDVINDDRVPFALVMEYVEGRSLKDLIAERKGSGVRFECRWAVGIVSRVAEALDHAHCDRGPGDGQFGIIHCDLKPANIVVDGDGKPHVLDFGLSVDRNSQQAEPRIPAGTLSYMSPEQLRGDRHWLKPTSDIWSLGVILYELLTGELPFRSRDCRGLLEEIEASPPRPPYQLRGAGPIPPELDRVGDVCLKCLTRDPHGRYQTARDLIKALDAALAPPSRPGPRIGKPALAGVLILAMILLGIAVIRQLTIGRQAPTGSAGPAALWPRLESLKVTFVYDRRERSTYTLAPIGERTLVRATALGPEDMFVLNGRFRAPTHWYLLWIDTSAHVKVEARSQTAMTEWRYPELRDVYASPDDKDPPGTHLLLVFASLTPFEDGERLLVDRLNGIGKPPRPQGGEPWHESLVPGGDDEPENKNRSGTTKRLEPGSHLPQDYLDEIKDRLKDTPLRPLHAIFLDTHRQSPESTKAAQ